MTDTKLAITWAIFTWIWLSSFLFLYLVDLCIAKLRALEEFTENIPNRYSWFDGLGNFKIALFFFRRRAQITDSQEIRRLFSRGKTLQVIYAAQLFIIFLFIFWLTS